MPCARKVFTGKNHVLTLQGGTRHEGTGASQWSSLTDFMFPGVVRNLHSIQLEALVTLANVVNSGDIGAHFIYNLHQLKDKMEVRLQAMMTMR